MTRLARSVYLLAALALALAALSGCGGGSSLSTDSSSTTAGADTAAASGDEVPVIVTFKQAPGTAQTSRVRRAGGRVKDTFTLIPAATATMTRKAMAALAADASVASVELDATVHASADSVNWNVTRVNATRVWSGGNLGAGVKVAIIDTGIDYAHSDLSPNYKGGYNFVARTADPLDDHGHGTHVAGIIGAAANGSGVEGVAPKASLYALKVLDKNGSGTYSNVIKALQWAVSHKMQLASMSLGSATNSKALHEACTAAYKAGVLLVAAAGNSGTPDGRRTTIEYPAAFGAVIAVGAVDSRSVRPYWSSTGAKLELAAPGVEISSDRLGGGLTVMSGTSMACPHVSGVAALIMASGVTAPAAVRRRLNSAAGDLGVTGRDSLYGYGLADAYEAVSAAALAALGLPATLL